MVDSNRLIGLHLVALQTDRSGNFVELIATDFFECFSFRLQLLVDLDGLLGHDFVSLLGAANQGKVGTGGDTFVTVRIKPHPQHHSFTSGFLLTR